MSAIETIWGRDRRRRVLLIVLAGLLALLFLSTASGMGVFGILGGDSDGSQVAATGEPVDDYLVGILNQIQSGQGAPRVLIGTSDALSGTPLVGLVPVPTGGGPSTGGPTNGGPTTTTGGPLLPPLPVPPLPIPGTPEVPQEPPTTTPEEPPITVPEGPVVDTSTGLLALSLGAGGDGTAATLLDLTAVGDSLLNLTGTLDGLGGLGGLGGSGYFIEVDASDDGIDVNSDTPIEPVDDLVETVSPGDQGIPGEVGGTGLLEPILGLLGG
jgi:hypothetical protein